MRITCLSKSFRAACCRCPWRADQIKNHDVPEAIGPRAGTGITVHDLYCQYRQGDLLYDDIEEKCDSPEIESLLRSAIGLEPQPSSHDEAMEMHILVDFDGKVASIDDARFQGYLDRVIFTREDGVVTGIQIVDLKTGFWVEDDRFERHCYVWLIACLFPEVTTITFTRLYARVGKIFHWDYSRVEDQWEVLDYRKGKHELVDLAAYLKREFEWIEQLEPKPIPGGHCSNWFGQACQFFGRECPLAQEMLPAVDAPLMVTDGPSAKERLLKVANAKAEDLTTADISWAFSGVDQLKGFLKKVELRIKQWSGVNGPFQVGDEMYGWRTIQKNEVNKELALSVMYGADMTFSDIAKVISISKTSIERLPKRYAEMKQLLLDTCVEVSNEKLEFGRLDAQD